MIRKLLSKNKSKILKGSVIFLSIFVLAWTIYSIYRIIASSAPDFSILWFSAKDFWQHQNPYGNPHLFTLNPNVPITFLYYAPLIILPYKIAQAIFVILSFFATIFCSYLSFKILNLKFKWKYFLLSLSLIFLAFPTKFTLGMGQINTIVFFPFLLSYSFYKRQELGKSGVLLGICVSLKPILAFFFLFFILKRQWKMILSAGLTILLGLAAALLITGPGVFVYWAKEVIPHFLVLSGREVYYNQGIMGFVSRIFGDIGTRKYLTAAISAFLILVTSRLTLIKKKEDLGLSLFIITLLLVDTLSWQHHFVWLIFPIITLGYYVAKSKKVWPGLLLVLAYLLVSWNLKNPESFSEFPKSLILSHTFYGTFTLYLLNIYFLKKQKIT
ncbi:MAG TPA: glycosyltransferase 87 family protein [Patescibacteria group bacterium]|nr:glycosyltransferase 87 family protein [Patescibacteria group bacterium]